MESFENLDLSKLKGVVFSGKDFRMVGEKNDKRRNRNKNKSERDGIAKNSVEKNALFRYFFGLASDYFEKQKDMFEKNIGDPELYIKKIKSKAKDKEIEVKSKVLELRKRVSVLKKKMKIAKKGKSKSMNTARDEKFLSELEEKLLNMQKELLDLQELSNGNLSFRPTHETGNNMDYQKFKNGMPSHGENSEKGISQNTWINERWDDIIEKNPDVIKKIGEDKDHQPGGKDNPLR